MLHAYQTSLYTILQFSNHSNIKIRTKNFEENNGTFTKIYGKLIRFNGLKRKKLFCTQVQFLRQVMIWRECSDNNVGNKYFGNLFATT